MKNGNSARKFVRSLRSIHAQCWAERVLMHRAGLVNTIPENHHGLTIEQARDISIEIDRLLR